VLDREFLEKRLQRAVALRERRGCNPRFHRMVWSESDGLPGLIVDRYDEVAVLQTLTMGMDVHKATIADLLRQIPGIRAVIERNDSSGRAAEQLPLQCAVLAGETDGKITLENHGCRFALNLLSGHKTGFYLDQMESHAQLAQWAKGRRMLDCFSNQGGFAITGMHSGAASAVAVESSADCATQIRANAQLNAVSVTVEEQDAFDYLATAGRRGLEFDLVVLDPPSFTKGKGGLHSALRGYRDLHLRAAKLLSKGGVLATFSCSHHVSSADFMETVREGLHDARRSAHLVRTLSQPADHPVLLAMPETEYLKGFVFEMIV
jgi:23S rRNA (cytosine1962-C5)-methyltransferase